MGDWLFEKVNPTMSVWLSDTLAVDFNLCMEISPPAMLTTQVFFLAEGKPPILFSLFDRKKAHGSLVKNDIARLESYTFCMAQRLKTLLMNFCTCDFAIVRFAVDIDIFNAQTLQEVVEKELTFTRTFFRGNVDLTSRSYADIRRATDALVCGSHIPSILQDKECAETSILLLDKPWSDGLSLMIEALNEGEIGYPPDAPFKVKVAALEAATRHSYSKGVVLSSSDKDIENFAKRIKQQAERDYHPEPNLEVKHTVAQAPNSGLTTVYLAPLAAGRHQQLLPKTGTLRNGKEKIRANGKNGESAWYTSGRGGKKARPGENDAREANENRPPFKKALVL